MKIENYMQFENPSARVLNKRESIQGFAIHGDIGFVSFHSGACAAYDLVTRSGEPIDIFKFGSFNAGDPDKRYANHANMGMFSEIYYEDGDEFPLLYVTAGNSGEQDENGYIGYCAVERISRSEKNFSSECVQKIYYNNTGIENTAWETPGWGWYAFFVDTKKELFYTLSARYRTIIDFIDKYDQNNYIVTKFKLPKLTEKGESVVLRPTDILDQIFFPFDVLCTQGGVLKDDCIWYTFGVGNAKYPDAIHVFDLEKREIVKRIDLSDSIFGHQEIECIDFYNGKILVNTNTNPGNLYLIDLDE